jgi:hypothetical protein
MKRLLFSLLLLLAGCSPHTTTQVTPTVDANKVQHETLKVAGSHRVYQVFSFQLHGQDYLMFESGDGGCSVVPVLKSGDTTFPVCKQKIKPEKEN